MVSSVDGCINGPGGEFIPPAWSSDLDAWTDEMPRRYDTLRYGRAAWVEMAAYWPRAELDPATPAPAREIVFSRTLTDTAAWTHSEIADADVATVVTRERALQARTWSSLLAPVIAICGALNTNSSGVRHGRTRMSGKRPGARLPAPPGASPSR